MLATRRTRRDRSFALFIFIAFGFAVSAATAQSGVRTEATNPLIGYWEGTAVIEEAELKMALTVELRDGEFEAVFTFPDALMMGRSASAISIDGGKITTGMGPRFGGLNFDGSLTGTDRIEGTVNAFGRSGAFELGRTEIDLPYTTKDLTFRSGEIELAGTLVVPEGEGPFPVIVTVHGSGDAPRWYNLPMVDLFARHGIAGFMFDKRGSGESGGSWQLSDFDGRADDVIAAVEMVKLRPEIDAERVGLWGISQAGWVMPIAASRSEDIKFMVVTSGSTVPVWREDEYSLEMDLRKRGLRDDVIGPALEYLRMEHRVQITGEGYAELKAFYRENRGEKWFREAKLGFPQPPNDEAHRSFMDKIIAFDSMPILRELRTPTLWIYGQADDSQPPDESAMNILTLRQEGHTEAEVIAFAEATHGMRIWPRPGKPFRWFSSPPGYHEAMIDWINSQIGVE